MGRSLRVWDPFGYPLEFFHAIEQFETQHQRFDLHRGAPILRFDHLNLHSPRVEDTFRFWLGLGFRCSEYISTDDPADERITGAWMLRKPTVHDVALTAGTGPRLHHFAYWIADPAGVMRACDQLAGGYRTDVIERGPGRHGVSNAFFVYLRDPDGHRIELYSCDYYTGDPDHKPHPLVGQRSALPVVLRHPRSRQLVRGVQPAARPGRRDRADRDRQRRRARPALRGGGLACRVPSRSRCPTG